MIEMLFGRVVDLKPTKVIINANGVGYGAEVTLSCSHQLQKGEDVSLYTYLAVREDALTLFGFLNELEKEMFLLLIEVNGVGPKLAQRILSEISPTDLAERIASENIVALTKLKGIGKKTAELLVLQLKSKLSKWAALELQGSPLDQVASEAVMALISLGVKDLTARKAVEKAEKILGENRDIATLITEALRHS